MAKVPNLECLHKCGDVLAKSLAYKAHRGEYEEILLGVEGDDQCKMLSSQFIARLGLSLLAEDSWQMSSSHRSYISF